MDEDLIKNRRSELSARQAAYVKNRAKGLPKQESAILAGYSEDREKAGAQVERSEVVQRELAKARAETARAVNTTKEDIAQMIIDAVEMARVMADPQAMVRGASELAKLLGHNAPEVKKHVHDLSPESKEALAHLRQLPDADLQRLAKGRVIEGTAVEVKDE